MLKVKNLRTEFKVGDKRVIAVDDISFEVPEKTVVGLVGESGSGKSVTSYSILDLLAANGKITSGQILWKEKDIRKLSSKEIRKIRGPEVGLIFQNPLAALNPVFTIGNQMVETIILHQNVNKEEAEKIAIELLKKVNIPDAESRMNDYPHQFSVGMCQRIMIALTLSMKPKLLIADEPTASLDVTIQAQILKLLSQLKEEYSMSMLFISHDLGVIAQLCDYILIMYLGKIIEKGTPKDIFANPLHPYTKALISSIPMPDPTQKKEIQPLKGDIPSPMNLPSGCRFHPRCPNAMPRCSQKEPLLQINDTSEVACFLYSENGSSAK
jgi:peptide/nickel transport system ATP-binding protein